MWALNKQSSLGRVEKGFGERVHETSSMCSEVVRTANTFPPLLGLSQPRPLCTCHLSFNFQVAVDPFRPSENGSWAFGGCLLLLHI